MLISKYEHAEFNLIYINDYQVKIITDLDMNISFRCTSEGKIK